MKKIRKEDSFKLLEKYGISVPPYKIIRSLKEAKEAFEEINPPVVLKVWSEKIKHKSDVGGVVVDIWDEKMLISSYKFLASKFKGAPLLIQKQINKGIELFMGIKKDEIFGRMLIFGLGGIYVEVFKDITGRICPINGEDFKEMVNELKSKKILLGYRGRKVNIKRLEEIAKKLCKIAEKENINEIDLNPIKVNEKEAYVLDVRIVF